MKKICVLLFSIPLLLLSACSSDESENCRYYVQQDLDQGNFQKVIDKLQFDQSCVNAYEQNEYLVDLGAAYMGRSGLTMTQIITALVENDDDEFSEFVNRLSSKANAGGVYDLSLSHNAYQEYLGKSCLTLITDGYTPAQQNVCLTSSFINLLKSVMAINMLANGNVDKWLSSDSPEDQHPLLMSTCALQFADKQETAPYACINLTDKLNNFPTVTEQRAITFQAPDSNEASQYELLKVSIVDSTEFFLASDELRSTIFTESFCATDFVECDLADGETCFPCPPPTQEQQLSVAEYLVDSLNSGLNSLPILTDNEDVLDSVNDFKLELRPDGQNVTLDDITNYLDNQ